MSLSHLYHRAAQIENDIANAGPDYRLIEQLEEELEEIYTKIETAPDNVTGTNTPPTLTV